MRQNCVSLTNHVRLPVLQLVQFRFQGDVQLWLAHIAFSKRRVCPLTWSFLSQGIRGQHSVWKRGKLYLVNATRFPVEKCVYVPVPVFVHACVRVSRCARVDILMHQSLEAPVFLSQGEKATVGRLYTRMLQVHNRKPGEGRVTTKPGHPRLGAHRASRRTL